VDVWPETLSLHVEGMDCSDEVLLAEKRLGSLERIASWHPDFMTQRVAGVLNARLLTICGATQDSSMLRRRPWFFSRKVNTPQGGLI
jgi:hypothetical protein